MEYSLAFYVTRALGAGTSFAPRGKSLHQGQAIGKLAATVAVLTARCGKGSSTVPGHTPRGKVIRQEEESLVSS